MSDRPARPDEVLLLQGEQVPLEPLLQSLQAAGFAVDVVADLSTARQSFFGRGGHDYLVVGPDVRPGLAHSVLHALRAVDPELPTATFGPELRSLATIARTATLKAWHPTSRAGVGALLRFLQSMRRRGR